MKWLDFISKIYLINLQKRTDRLLESAEILEQYEIPYEVFVAIEKPNGAEGLRDTMLELFKQSIKKGYSNVLVLEDDFKMVQEPFWFHDTMNKIVKQLPENYWLCYLGGQPTIGYTNFYSENLLPALKYYSTHSVIYSKQGMKEILTRNMDYPIDNWIVNEIQSQGNCYAVNPILCSQRAGFSDIGGTEMDWNPFIVPIHEQKISAIKKRW